MAGILILLGHPKVMTTRKTIIEPNHACCPYVFPKCFPTLISGILGNTSPWAWLLGDIEDPSPKDKLTRSDKADITNGFSNRGWAGLAVGNSWRS